MATLSIAIALMLTALIIAQVMLSAGFIAHLRRPSAPTLSDDECPKVALIICIRGKDPTLLQCLNGALNQDYPDFGVYIVVDSRSDPAWPLVNKLVAANPQTQSTVQVLKDPLTTCSLKCSSLIQAISNLDETYKIVALLDSDVIPHRCWIRELVAPLEDMNVGASTGLHWFVSERGSLTNLARHASDAAAVVLMSWLGIASGCSLAIKRAVIQEGRLLDRWANSYGEDTSLSQVLNELGLRLEIVHSAMLPESEDCEFADLKNWLTRQLLSCRLHHRGWWGVILHGFSTSLVLGLGLVSVAAGIFWQQWGESALLAGALIAYFISMAGLLAWLDGAVLKAAGLQSSVRTQTNGGIVWKTIPSIVLAQIVYVISLFSAVSAKSVEWRGIQYRINRRCETQMVKYRPLQSERKPRLRQHQAGIANT